MNVCVCFIFFFVKINNKNKKPLAMGKKREYVKKAAKRAKNAIREIRGDNLLPGETHGLLWVPGKGIQRSNFMGPGTDVFTRLARDDHGKTAIDEISRLHDVEYTLANNSSRTDEEQLKMGRIQEWPCECVRYDSRRWAHQSKSSVGRLENSQPTQVFVSSRAKVQNGRGRPRCNRVRIVTALADRDARIGTYGGPTRTSTRGPRHVCLQHITPLHNVHRSCISVMLFLSSFVKRVENFSGCI